MSGGREVAWVIGGCQFDLLFVDGRSCNPERLWHTITVGRLTGLAPGMSSLAWPTPESLPLVGAAYVLRINLTDVPRLPPPAGS